MALTSGNQPRAGVVLTAEDTSSPAFAAFRRNLAATQAEAKGLGDSVGGLAGKFGTIGLALSAAFAGASLKGVIDVGDQLSKLSEKTGITVESLSGLRYAGELAGVPMDALSTGMKKLAVTMLEAAGGAKDQGRIFQALGMNLKDMNGNLKGSDQVLMELADKFAGFQDGPEKAALAVKLFGKAGTDMIPLLNQGSAGLRDMKDEAQNLGVVFSAELAKSSEQFNDNLRKIEFSAEGGKRAIADELLPTLNTLAEAFLETRDGSASMAKVFGGALRDGFQGAAILVANVAYGFKTLGYELAGIAAQVVEFVTGDWTTFAGHFTAISDAVSADTERAKKELADFEQRIRQTADNTSAGGAGLAKSDSIREREARDAARKARRPRAPIVDRTGPAEAASDYERLNKTIGEHMAAMDAELEKGRALTEMEKLEAKVIADIDHAKKELTVDEMLALDTALQAAKAKELLLQIDRAQLKQVQEMAAERQRLRNLDYNQSADAIRTIEEENAANLKSVKDHLLALEDEEQATTLAAAKNISLAEAIERVALARLQDKRAKVIDGSDSAVALDLQIAEQQKLIAATAGKATREEWQKTADTIGSALTDAGVSAFHDITHAGDIARQALIKMFDDLVLRPTISAIMNPISQSIASIIQPLMGGITSSITSAMGLPSISSALGLGGAASSLTTGATGLFGNAVAGDAFLPGALGSGSTGLSGIFGAIPGIGWAALGVAAAAYIFGDKGGGPKSEGGYAPAGLTISGTDIGGNQQGSVRGDTANAQKISESISTGFEAVAKQFGVSVKLPVGVFYAVDSADGGTSKTQLQVTSTNYNRSNAMGGIENVDRGDPAFQAAIVETQADLYLTELQHALTGHIGDYFKSLDPLQLSAEQINAAITAAAAAQDLWKAFDQLGPSFSSLANMTVEATGAFADAAGGLDALKTNLSSYYDNFYTAEEKRHNVASQISATLGAAGLNVTIDQVLGATREQFRAVMDQYLAMGPAGAAVVQALLQVNGAFASLAPALDATGTAADTAAQSLQKALESFNTLADDTGIRSLMGLSDDVKTALINIAGGIDALSKGINDYYKNFYSPEEQRQQTIRNITATVNAAGVNVTEDQVGHATREQFRQVVDSLDLTTESGRKAYVALMSVSDAFASITPVAQDAAAGIKQAFTAAVDAAYSALDRAVNAQRNSVQVSLGLAQEQVATIQGVFDELKGQISSLYGEVASTAAMSAANGQKFIGDALSAAQTTGYLPDSTQLGDAITAARGGMGNDQYKSAFDAARDRLVLAGKLSDLQKIAGPQLTAAQQMLKDDQDQLKSLDDLLGTAKQQIDALNGIDTSVLTVAAALKQLNDLLDPNKKKTTTTTTTNKTTTGTGGGGFSMVGGGTGGSAVSSGSNNAAIDWNDFQDYFNTHGSGQGGPERMAWYLSRYGQTQASTAAALGIDLATVKQYFDQAGIPAFASGTPYVPQTGLAVLHQGEAVMPAPVAQRWRDSGDGSEALIAEVRALREMVTAQAQALDRIASSSQSAAETLNGQQQVPLLVQMVTQR